MDNEIWKAIEGFNGVYEVSNLGQVRNIKRQKIMKMSPRPNGYLRISLYNGKGYNYYSIHRLVAITFLPNPDNLPQVNHKDSNKINNCVDNLEWCTASHNMNHVYENERNKLQKKVNQIDIDTEKVIKTFRSATFAGTLLNINPGLIWFCCNNRLDQAGGYKWTYTS